MREKICVRKEKMFSPESSLSFRENEKRRERIMSNNSNRINVPEAKEAMNQFKMQAASDLDVFFTS